MQVSSTVFEVDRRFSSLHEAAEFLVQEYAQELPDRVWREDKSGLLIPEWAPKYLFRGEDGDYPTTVAGILRPNAFRMKVDGRRLAATDQLALCKLVPDLERRFCEDDYSLDHDSATGLLQHYGLPTTFIDFTVNLRHAFTFAGSGLNDNRMGRVCVINVAHLPTTRLIALTDHPWCERPRRQDAYALAMRPYLGPQDLKAKEVRRALRLRWYEFPVSDDDRQYCQAKHAELIRLDDDPSAGFIRHHITEYVEANGKLSPLLTDWLLERIPVMPRCYEVMGSENGKLVLRHVPPSVIGEVNRALELDRSRRYWSNTFPDCSRDRMKNWSPPVGTVCADPRTRHGIPRPTH